MNKALFKQVNIEIKDGKYYTDVALLVDREDFTKDLNRLRKKWKLDKKLLIFDPDKPTFGFPWTTTKERSYKYFEAIHPFVEKMENPADIDKLVQMGKDNKFFKAYEKARRIHPAEDFYLDIRDLRIKYRRPFHFDQIIAHAVLYGIVRNEDYVACEMVISEPEYEFIDYEKEPELIIRFSPLVKAEEIRKLLTKNLSLIQKEYKKNILNSSLYKISPRWKLEKYREWYWINKYQDKSYKDILDEQNGHYSEGAIGLGINRYRKLLSIKLTK